MQSHIFSAPTAEQVSKLRKAAKLLVRDNTCATHAQALDQVAQAAGYHHWKHVTELGAPPNPMSRSSRSYYELSSSNPKPTPQHTFTIVDGRSGTGKSFYATEVIVDRLRDGLPVSIYDWGRSFTKLVQTLGGIEVNFGHDGEATIKDHGETGLLQVFEFEETGAAKHLQGIFRELPLAGPRRQDALLVVDETYFIDRLFTDLPSLLQAHVGAGGSLLLLMQEAQDTPLFARYAAIQTPSGVARRSFHLGGLARM